METNSPFNPSPTTTAAIFADIARGGITLLGLAERYRVDLCELVHWLNSSPITAHLQAIEAAAVRIARLGFLSHTPQSQAVVAALLSGVDHREISDARNHPAREQARRLVNLHLRHARLTPPARARDVASRGRDHSSKVSGSPPDTTSIAASHNQPQSDFASSALPPSDLLPAASTPPTPSSDSTGSSPAHTISAPPRPRQHLQPVAPAAHETRHARVGSPTPPAPAQPAAGPVTVGPVTAGPVTTGPVTAGPVTAGPVTAGPVTAGPASPALHRLSDPPIQHSG